MATTKKTNIDELEQQCLEAEKVSKALREQLAAAKREEAEQKKAKLEAEKDARYKEVINAYDNYEKLRDQYMEDYGCFTFHTKKNTGDIDWLLKAIGLIE